MAFTTLNYENIVRGDDWSFSYTITDADENTVDLRGYTFYFTMKAATTDTDANAALQISKYLDPDGDHATDAQNGIVKLEAASLNTKGINPGVYQYDLQQLDDSNKVTTLYMGTVTVLPDVTRAIVGTPGTDSQIVSNLEYATVSYVNNLTSFSEIAKGSLSELALKFTSDTNTGFYGKDNGDWALVSDGVEKLEITNDGIDITGDLTVSGDTTISGNLTFGNADDDNVSFTAEIDSDFVPNVTNTYTLGTSSKEWQDLHLSGTAHADTVSVNTITLDGTTITSTAEEVNKLDGFTGVVADLNYAKDLRATGVTTAEFDTLDGITATTSELNTLDGITATTAELNKLDGFTGNHADLNFAKDLNARGITFTEFDTLDGITATTAELNTLDGITATTAELNAVAGLTATTTELNVLDGITATTNELNILDGVTASPTELNILDGATVTTAELNRLDGISASTLELNKLDGVTATTAELNVLDGITATTTELNYVDGVTSSIQTQLNEKQNAAALGTAAFTASTAYATAAQGALADSAIQSSDLTPYATTQYVDDEVAALVDSSPAALNTLNELAEALGDDPNFSATISNTIGLKAPLANPQFSGTASIPTASITTLNLNGTQVTATAAELNTLDGITATTTELNYTDGVTSNIQTQLNAMVEKAGDTMTGDLSLGDNVKAKFGAGNDLQIYHDGTSNTSYIKETGVGSFQIEASNLFLKREGGTESFLDCVTNGALTAYYDGSAKLATTSTGVDVTGTVTANGLTVDNGGALVQKESDTGIGGLLQLKNTRNALGTGNGNRVEFIGGNNDTRKAYVDSRSTANYGRYPDLVFGSETDASGEIDHLKIKHNGDVEFYEDTGTTAKMVWDASREELRTNQSTPIELGDTTGEGVQLSGDDIRIKRNCTTSTQGLLHLNNIGTAGNVAEFYLDGVQKGAIGVASDASLTFVKGTGSSEAMRIDSSGKVGIGTSSPSSQVHIAGQTNGTLRMDTTASGYLDCSMYSNGAFVGTSASQPLRFGTSNTERMRIDPNGNLLVGKTSPNITTLGIELHSSDYIASTADAQAAAYFTRKSNDGDIALFRKDSSTVGSIGVAAGNELYFSNGSNVGIRTEQSGSDRIIPCNGSGTARDASIDLGSASERFGNLFLSGGLRGDTLKFSDNSGTERMRIDSSDNVTVTGNLTASSELRVKNTTNYVGIDAPTGSYTSWTMTLPTTDGAAGEVLSTDGSGNTSWVKRVAFFAQSAAPTYANGARDGDLWRDTDDGSVYIATETGSTVQWFAI